MLKQTKTDHATTMIAINQQLLLHHNPQWQAHNSLRIRPSRHPPFATQTSFTQTCCRAFAVRSLKLDFSRWSFNDGSDDNDGGGDSRRRKRRSNWRGSKKRRRWWSDVEEPRSGTVDQVVDSIWILKVVKSYGWFSPVILLSLLLATGPKAFLIAFSIPLGLSVLFLVFEKLQEWIDGGRKPKRSRKTRSSYSKRNDSSVEEEEEEDDDDNDVQDVRRRWKVNWKRATSESRTSDSSFGGWDELVGE